MTLMSVMKMAVSDWRTRLYLTEESRATRAARSFFQAALKVVADDVGRDEIEAAILRQGASPAAAHRLAGIVEHQADAIRRQAAQDPDFGATFNSYAAARKKMRDFVAAHPGPGLVRRFMAVAGSFPLYPAVFTVKNNEYKLEKNLKREYRPF